MKKLLLILLLIAPTIRATDYVDSTLGAYQQALGCNYCGTQRPTSGVGGPAIFIGQVIPANTGFIDSIAIRASSNGTVVKLIGIVYDGTTSVINNFICRSKDSASLDNSVNMATTWMRFTPNTYQLTASAVYYIGGFTDSTNSSTVRFGTRDTTGVGLLRCGTQDGATAVANWTTASYGQLTSINQPAVVVYYHSGGAATPTTTVIRGSVIRGSVIR